MRAFIYRYRFDLLAIAVLGAISLTLSVVYQAEMKPIARGVAYAGPVIFATCLMAFIAAMSLTARRPAAAKLRRPLIDIAVASVAIAISMSKAEVFYAPFALAAGQPPAAVVAQIAQDQNVPRFEAWSRILTFNIDQKNEVAVAMAGLLTGDDERARASASLTLDYALRRHAITTLIALAPEVKSFIEAKGAGLPPNPPAERAAAFASAFVGSGYKNVLKALEPKNRENLPPGGVDALFLALATNEPIGILFLKGFPAEGDEELKAKAQETLQLVAFVPTT